MGAPTERAPRTATAATLALCVLAWGCGSEATDAAPTGGALVSAESIAAVEARIHSEGAGASDALVALVIASPVDLPPGELDRLGQLLLQRCDDELLLEHLRELSVAHPESADLRAWLERLIEYEHSILRGVDVPYDD